MQAGIVVALASSLPPSVPFFFFFFFFFWVSRRKLWCCASTRRNSRPTTTTATTTSTSTRVFSAELSSPYRLSCCSKPPSFKDTGIPWSTKVAQLHLDCRTIVSMLLFVVVVVDDGQWQWVRHLLLLLLLLLPAWLAGLLPRRSRRPFFSGGCDHTFLAEDITILAPTRFFFPDEVTELCKNRFITLPTH